MTLPRSIIHGSLALSLAFAFVAQVAAHDPAADFEADVTTDAKPWTHLEFQNDPDNFQFAVVTDRTGSPRAGVFQDAVKKLNWMMPEFVISIGDLIQGTSENAETHDAEWEEFMGWIEPLKMPFFFAAGNHDIQMKWIEGRVQPEEALAEWNERFGPTHYSFVYKDVLFVVLFTNDNKEQYIGEAQAAYFEETLAEHQDVRWTFVLLHHPLWAYSHESNFDRIEDALVNDGRRYTVLAGHQHRYVHFDRNDSDYIILASTGGGSKMRGKAFGEFDHFAWFTMTEEGPVMANLDLSGIYPKDVTQIDSITWVRDLQQSTYIESAVMLDENANGTVRAAAAFLTFHNRSSEPLRIEAKFGHSHHVHPSLGNISRVLPPGESEVVEVEFQVLEPFRAADKVMAELEAEMQLVGVGNEGLSQTVTKPIVFTSNQADVFRTESVEFTGSTKFPPTYARDARVVRFTIDGSDPTAASPLLTEPLHITSTTELRARVYSGNGIAGPVDQIDFMSRPAGSGLWARYYEYPRELGKIRIMPNLEKEEPHYVQHVDGFNVPEVTRVDENFVVIFHGWLEIEEAGNYGFHVENEDGARLLIDGELVVDDMILHPRRETSGFARLEAGRHPIELHFCQTNKSYHLGVEMTGPDGMRRPIPASALSVDGTSQPRLQVPLAIE